MRQWLAAAAMLGAAVALFAPAARAQPRKVTALAVALDRRLESDAVAATAIVRRLLQNDARFELADPASLALGDTRGQQARKAAGLAAEALGQLDEMQDQKAAQKAAEAVAAYEAADLTTAFPGLLDAIAARAFAFHSAGDKAQSRSELARLFALKVDYRLDPRRVAPDLSQIAEEARGRVRKAARVSLEVRSTPVAAEVFVDGAYRGVTPLEVAGLAPGSHYVTLRSPGYDLAQSRQAAGLGSPVELALAPAPAEGGLLALIKTLQASRPPGSDGSGAALARWAKVPEALVVGLQKKGEATWAVATRWAPDGKAWPTLEEPLASIDAVEDLARRALQQGGGSEPFAARAPPPTSAGEVRASSGGSSARRTWGLVAAGAGVAALGGGVVLGLAASSKATDARNTPQTDRAAYQSTSDSAKKMALGANVLYGVAAVGAGTAIYLLLTGGSSAGSAAAGVPAGPQALSVAVAPVQGGAALSLAGAF